jgi:hypothetical protein
MFGELAERLAVPWHGVDLVMHLGGCAGVDMRPVLQEAVAWVVANDGGEGAPYGFSGAGDDGSPLGVAAKERRRAFDAALSERFREPLRRAWDSPSVRAVFSSCPQLMLPGTSDYGMEAASRRGLLAELLAVQDSSSAAGGKVVDAAGADRKVSELSASFVPNRS